MLRQSANEDTNRIDGIELLDRVFGQNVDHPRRKSTVGYDGDVLLPGFGVECLLLEDDLGVAAEVREVNSRLIRHRGEIEVEVLRNSAHHRACLALNGDVVFTSATI